MNLYVEGVIAVGLRTWKSERKEDRIRGKGNIQEKSGMLK